MSLNRVMDEQQDCIFRLQALYEKLKKEPVPRRTPENLTKYEQQRELVWSSIEANNGLLMDNAPPEGYVAKFEEAKVVNSKFMDRLKTWRMKNEADDVVNAPPQVPPTIPPPVLYVNPPPIKFQPPIVHSYVPTTIHQPISSEYSPAILTTSAMSMTPTFTTTMSHNVITTTTSSSSMSAPILSTTASTSNQEQSSPSWNSLIDAEQAQAPPSPSITQLLCMLAENQKEMARLTANQLKPRHLEPSKIDLLPFDGNVKQFRQFRDMFGRAVSSCKWSNIDLFMYLQSKLTGDAYNAIAALEITDDTYFLAWEILDRRFNNKRKLLEATLQPLLDDNFRVEHNNCMSGKTFMSKYQGLINNLKQYKATVEEVVMELLLPRLNETTRSRFEDHIGRDAESQTPSFEQLDYFFEKELRIWANTVPTSTALNPSKPKPMKTKAYVTMDGSQDSSSDKIKCFICQKNHIVTDCEQFLGSNDRHRLLKFHKVCIYCTKHRFKGKICMSKRNIKCDICQGQHITLMHPLSSAPTENTTSVHVTQDVENNLSTVLPTAVVTVTDLSGCGFPVRCLVDLCAERSYICESIVQMLRLKKHKLDFIISGINGITGRCTSFVNLVLKIASKDIVVNALVVPKITGLLPSIPKFHWSNQSEYQWADPPSKQIRYIGVLLGADIAPKLFVEGVSNQLTPEGYLLQPTHVGWLISGSAKATRKYVNTFVTLNENAEKLYKEEELTKRILAFYELPEPELNNGEIDNYCEKLFQEKHYRMEDGRYVVPIPWKTDAPKLGHSYRKAVKMFTGQETKWRKNPEHYKMSNAFMQEYEESQHMTLNVEDVKSDSGDVYYIPYLSVLRKDALTTKLRNVFNASMPSSNGVSLNDQMWEGPKLQTNIRDILITARSFKYLYSADIAKMFRQVMVLPEDREKLRIIWRPSSSDPIHEYKLNTITYGTDSAPFLAIRTIQQAGKDNAPQEIAEIINKAFYVDDLLYGSDSINEAKQQIEDIKNALLAGKFPLTKWMSNSEQVLSSIPNSDRITAYIEPNCHMVKLMGVVFDFKADRFQLNLKEPEVTFTKRGILSASASFYDPMGFILPFIMALRLFLRNLWRLKIDWDDKINDTLKSQFENCISGVPKLNAISIPRHIPSDETNEVELIGFADASNNAQAAVIYSRIATNNGYKVTFVTAKVNVTKLKTSEVLDSKQCTIPKMELEALVTLCELFKVIQNFNHRKVTFTAYTDSQVVLSWIRNNKCNDTKFIERRVTKIRNIIAPEDLHHVKSEDNPADPASRGLSAEKLSTSSLWFLGPAWLQLEDLPKTPFQPSTSVLLTQAIHQEDMFERFSDWEKILRVVAMCLRWKSKIKGTVTANEIIHSKRCVIHYFQQFHLSDAIDCLKKGKLVSKKHWLYRLSPFLDNNGILRVGGRLGNASEIPESQRHPIVIPKGHGLNLLVKFIHLKNGHCGTTLMLRLIVEEYWVPGIKNIIKTCTRKCTTCIRWNARTIQPHMSQLPEQRVTSSLTFNTVGLDLCGPFTIKASPLRFDRTMKVWVVNFVCFATKATHLELVTSLSSEHFIAAFTRFCSRRGVSSEVWSDNGTNLVGANRMLQEAWEKAVKGCEVHTAIQEVRWKFIPRHSPTFGGLWEAGVKSLKYFTKRMEDVKNLTYEEFTTLLCKIEALLNSRPLHPNPLCPEDEPALTPFHFLNQRGYKPVALDSQQKVPLTKKWMMIHNIQREFWQRFKIEYLRELQAKAKWVTPQPNLAKDDVVLIKEPSMVPGDWKMGRVTKTYPDPQGVVRKVALVTANKEEKTHAVNQLVPLLKEDEQQVTSSNQTNESDNPEPSTSSPRRSSRIAAKMSLVHLCLLTLLLCTPPIRSNPTETLAPGMHLRRIGNVYLQSFNIDFSIKTTLNVTHDLHLIQKTVDEFHSECTSLCKPYPKVAAQCSSLHSNIGKIAEKTAIEIKNGYSPKTKRWISLTTKGILKAAPFIATTMGMVYQETEIWSLRRQVADAKTKMVLTANALLNITEVEYEAIEGKLNEVIAKQQEVLMEESVLNYAQNIELLLINLKMKHETITDVKPYAELLAFIEPVLAKLPKVTFPDIGDSVFLVHPAKKIIKDGLVIVSFTIPMVQKQPINLWAIISAPTIEGYNFILGNNAHVQHIIVDNNNNTYAEITQRSLTSFNILNDITMVKMDNCLSQVFSGATPSSCNVNEVRPNEISALYDDLVVVINTVSIPITCHNQTTMLGIATTIVNTSVCTIVTNGHAFTGHQFITLNTDEDDDIPKPTMESMIAPLTHNPSALLTRMTLKEELNRWTSPDSGQLIIMILSLGLLVSSIIICVRCITQRHQPPTPPARWFPEYIGPTRMTTLPPTD